VIGPFDPGPGKSVKTIPSRVQLLAWIASSDIWLSPLNATLHVPAKQFTSGYSAMQRGLAEHVWMTPRVHPVSSWGAFVPGLDLPLAKKYGNASTAPEAANELM
jgi:hypothetical protein